MAGNEEFLIPDVTAREINSYKVEVSLKITGLRVKRTLFGADTPEDNVTVTPINFSQTPFNVEAVVTDEKGAKVKRRYRYLKRSLPGEIIAGDCKYKYKDDHIILVFAKATDASWEPAIRNNELFGDTI